MTHAHTEQNSLPCATKQPANTASMCRTCWQANDALTLPAKCHLVLVGLTLCRCMCVGGGAMKTQRRAKGAALVVGKMLWLKNKAVGGQNKTLA